MFVCVFGVTLNQVLLDEGEHEAEQCQHLDECQTQEHEGLQTAAELRLASGAFDGLADQDAQTDARADGGEAVANDVQVARLRSAERHHVWRNVRFCGDEHVCSPNASVGTEW